MCTWKLLPEDINVVLHPFGVVVVVIATGLVEQAISTVMVVRIGVVVLGLGWVICRVVPPTSRHQTSPQHQTLRQ